MWLYAMVMKMIEDEKHNNVVTNDSNVVVIGNEGVFVNGKKYPLPNYKCSPSTVINNRMFVREECKYYAPCGLCTYYDKPCSKICGTKTKYIDSNAITPIDNPPHEKITPFMKERE